MKNILITLITFICTTLALIYLSTDVYASDTYTLENATDVSITIDDEGAITSSNPTGKTHKDYSVYKDALYNNPVYTSDTEVLCTNFLVILNYKVDGKSYKSIRVEQVIYTKDNKSKVSINGFQFGETNYIVYSRLVNSGSNINYENNTKVTSTSGITYMVTFDNLNTFSNDLFNYIDNFVKTGQFSETTVDISNSDWDADGNPVSSDAPIRDIETPKNVKVLHTKNMDRWDFRINWDVPEMNGNHYYVNISVADYLKFKKFKFQNYHNFTVGWHEETREAECSEGYYIYKIDEDVACHKGLAKAWQEEYGGDMMSLSKAKMYFNMEGSLLSASWHDFVKKWKYPGITIQFWYRDENGRKHTSNYVQLTDIDECDGYVANELTKFDYLNDGNSGDIADTDSNVVDKNIDNSSGNYDGTSDVMGDNNEDIENKSAIEILKSMLNDLKSYPDFFVEFFSFLPGQISQYLYALIIVMIPLLLLKLVRG